MKKKLAVLLMAVCMLSGCDMIDKTCKAAGCEETSIYEDGYCKTHYYINVGGNIIKDIFKGYE